MAETRTGLKLIRNPANLAKAHRRSVRDVPLASRPGSVFTVCSVWVPDAVEVPANQVALEDRCQRCEKIHGGRA